MTEKPSFRIVILINDRRFNFNPFNFCQNKKLLSIKIAVLNIVKFEELISKEITTVTPKKTEAHLRKRTFYISEL